MCVRRLCKYQRKLLCLITQASTHVCVRIAAIRISHPERFGEPKIRSLPVVGWCVRSARQKYKLHFSEAVVLVSLAAVVLVAEAGEESSSLCTSLDFVEEEGARERVIPQPADRLKATPAMAAIPITLGSPDSFMYSHPTTTVPPIKIFYHAPSAFNPSMPVVMVLHGVSRDASDFVEASAKRKLPDKHACVLLIPEVSTAAFPGKAEYNSGNVFVDDDPSRPVPEDQWLMPILEGAVTHFMTLIASTNAKYTLFGHSAGGQLAHRFAAFMGRRGRALKTDLAVAANSGFYTMPTRKAVFPYGFGGCEEAFSDADIAAFLQVPLMVLLGTADTDPNHKLLNRSPEAMLQGEHRMSRGLRFLEEGRAAAAAMQVPFGWRQAEVKGVGHNKAKMLEGALALLFPPKHSTPDPSL